MTTCDRCAILTTASDKPLDYQSKGVNIMKDYYINKAVEALERALRQIVFDMEYYRNNKTVAKALGKSYNNIAMAIAYTKGFGQDVLYTDFDDTTGMPRTLVITERDTNEVVYTCEF